MKNKIFTVILGLLSTMGIYAQQPKDTVLTRQLELEREFNPTLQDANKINSLPAIHEPQVSKANRAYATWATHATPPLEIALSQPGKIMTDIPFSLQKGYLFLNAGNYANIDGALGYRFLDGEIDKLSLMFLHNSSNGDLNYNQGSESLSVKSQYMDNYVKLNYGHTFEGSKLNLHASYLNSQFNYYGNTFGDPRLLDDKKQMLGVFNVKAALQSTQTDLINYYGSFNFHNFTTKYGRTLNDKSLNGNQVEAIVDLNKSFMGGDNLIGVKGDFTGVFYEDVKSDISDKISNFLMLDANPYVHFEGFNWKVRLGANLDFVFDDENKFYVSPNVALSVMLTENSSLYLNAMGGVAKNTYLDMYKESRYIRPNTIVKHSYSPVDIVAGTKIGAIDGFRIDIFGGYKKTEEEHFLVLQQTNTTDPFTYQEFLTPLLGDIAHSHIGGRIQSNIWSPLDVSVKVQKNFYSVTKAKGLDVIPTDLKAWNKPGFETDIQATFSGITNLKLMLGYYFANDRWSVANESNVKMNNINDLNAGAIYNINEMFSINLKANNILDQSHDIWYGYPAQGVNILGGFTFKF
ncbi:MAG: hypothetical protein ACOH2V_07645 [Candidatus Saccharimonadaceae bacterium]